jgi:hypothetical protein
MKSEVAHAVPIAAKKVKTTAEENTLTRGPELSRSRLVTVGPIRHVTSGSFHLPATSAGKRVNKKEGMHCFVACKANMETFHVQG